MKLEKNLFFTLCCSILALQIVAFDSLPTTDDAQEKEDSTRMLCVGPAGPTGPQGLTGPVKTYEVQLNAHSVSKNGTTYPTTIVNNMFGSTSGILNVNLTTQQIPNQTAPATSTPLAFEFSIPFGAMTVLGNVPYTLNLHLFTIGHGETEPSSYTVQIRARAAYRANNTALNPGDPLSETVQTNNISVTVPNTTGNTNQYLISMAMTGSGAAPGSFGLIAIDQPVGTFDADDNLYLAVADLVFSVT